MCIYILFVNFYFIYKICRSIWVCCGVTFNDSIHIQILMCQEKKIENLYWYVKCQHEMQQKKQIFCAKEKEIIDNIMPTVIKIVVHI